MTKPFLQRLVSLIADLLLNLQPQLLEKTVEVLAIAKGRVPRIRTGPVAPGRV